MRLMKKLATLAMRLTSPPLLANCFRPAMYASATLLIHVLREEQRHVDIDAFADELLDRGNPFRRAGHFDHQVFAAHRFPQAARFVDGLLSLVREVGRNLQAYVAVARLRPIVNRAQEVGGVLNVLDRQLLVASLGVQILALFAMPAGFCA